MNRFLDRVYSPDRVLHPLRRVGPKGSGEFEQISWDDALAEIAARAARRSSPSTAARRSCRSATPATRACSPSQGIADRFFHHIGASRLLRNICGPTVGAGVSMTNGTGLGVDPLDIEHSQLILLWGTNTRLTNRHLWPMIERGPRQRCQVVVIDPIRTHHRRGGRPVHRSRCPAPTSR